MSTSVVELKWDFASNVELNVGQNGRKAVAVVHMADTKSLLPSKPFDAVVAQSEHKLTRPCNRRHMTFLILLSKQVSPPLSYLLGIEYVVTTLRLLQLADRVVYQDPVSCRVHILDLTGKDCA